jgi:predicted alpha/beta-hydrolase family hydrolase
MTSQAQAEALLPNVIGLAFVGFPLHPAGRPSAARAEHLSAVDIPILFLQGSRDALAELPLMKAVVTNLGSLAELKVIDGADHSFHMLARSGRTDPEAMSEILDAMQEWTGTVKER